MITRRELLASLGVGWLAEQVLPRPRPIAGRIVGRHHRAGHLLRRPPDWPTAPTERAEVVIVGSGPSGASAAWRLAAAGVRCRMLELEPWVGGTSAWEEEGVVPHPWAAHYLPVPERGALATWRLLRALRVITGFDAAGRPRFDEQLLCHAPEQRLHLRGRWHRHLVPLAALGRREREEMRRFAELTERLARARGADGREAFALPCEQSSRDGRWLELDSISMAAWLAREGYHSPFARWYVGYGMLDDFGAALDQVSAWAGLHYFAARKLGTAQLGATRYLVWPQGNGWLVERLLHLAQPQISTRALVTQVAPRPKGGVLVRYLDLAHRTVGQLAARAAIVATPDFIARRLLAPLGSRALAAMPRRVTAPWLVANLHVERPADPNRAWDSTAYGATGLGYVDAGHQLAGLRRRTVLTYYRAFGAADTAAVRRRLLAASWAELGSEVLVDLGRSEPELPGQTQRIDLMRWGHAMPRPVPGFIGTPAFEVPCLLDRAIGWAHVDQSGMALFEEANLRGVRAGERIADALGAPRGESWL